MSSLTVEEDQKWLPTHVQVTVLRGRGLRGKGKHGTSDVYTIIQLAKEKYSTCVAEKTTEPEWREECSFELQPGVLETGGGRSSCPAGSNELVLIVMHRALMVQDVFLGQAVIQLDKVFHETRCVKNEWYKLNSKSGKKEKERGDIQVTVQFTRNNLTASMYDLVMKDKGASTFGKLKERIKGKRRSNEEDSASAVLPSGYGSLHRMRQRLPSDGGGEEDYEDDEGGEARRSKMRTFFLRGKLRKSSDTRSSTSLGSESSESSSRGGSLSPTAGISVVVSDLSNSPSNSSNLTVDNSPEHTSSLICEFGDEDGEITIAVPQLTVCVNGSHAYGVQPPDPGSGKPADSLGLGPLQKSLPLSVSLQNLRPSTDLLKGPVGDGRRWSFDKPCEEEKAAIAAALEQSGPMLGDEEEEELGRPAPPKSASSSSSTVESESQGKKQRRNLFSQGRSESAGRGQSQSKDESEQAHAAATEEKHKGWFGSKDSHSKPSLVVSPKLEPSTDPHPPPSHHPPGPPVDPAPPVSPLHHTNPFSHLQTPPPPISPCNPFFSVLQHNPFYDDPLTPQPLKPSLPPLPYLSTSRPPIAQLFPQAGNPTLTHDNPPTEDAVTGAVEKSKARERPLKGEKPLSMTLPGPFSFAGELNPESEWDESFEAFAAGRLQSPEDLTTDCKTQQNTPGDHPLEPCADKGASLPITDPNTNSNDALHHQPYTGFASDAQKALGQATSTSHFDTFSQFLETIPEHASFEIDNIPLSNTPELDACAETNQANSATNANDLTDTNGHQAPCHSPFVKLNSSSPDPGSSGIGSSEAEKDFLSRLSSYSDKFSASSSEEAEPQHFESNILCFEKSSDSSVVKHSESEDDITDRSTDLSLVDGAQNTVIQHGDADGEADLSGLERPLAQQPPVLTHQQPVINASEDAGTQSPNFSSTDLLPEIQPESKESLQSDNENGEKHTGEVLQDFSTVFNDSSVSVSDTMDIMTFTTPDEKLDSTPPSLDIITSSPEVRRSSSDSPFESTDVGGQDASQRSPIPFGLFGDFHNAGNHPLEPCADKGASLPITDPNTNSNDALHHQPYTGFASDAQKALGQATSTSHFDTFAQFLETIPEHASFEIDSIPLSNTPDLSGLERSLAQQPPVLTHQHPVINASEDAGTQSPNLSSTDLLPEIQPESKESLQSDNENGEKQIGEVLQDLSTAFNDSSVSVSDTTDIMTFTTPDEKLYSTPPSLDIITSSPEVRRSSSDSPIESTDVGGQDASQRSPIPFGLFGDFLNAGDHPLEHCADKGASLPITDPNTNSNDALHHQPYTGFASDAQKALGQATSTSHFDTFAQFLETIPEHASFEIDNIPLSNTPELDASSETNQANSATNTNDLTDTNGHQAPCHSPFVKLNSSSPDPGSSGIGSSEAEKDFLSRLSSYSDKFSASSSEEAEAQHFESNILCFEKSSDLSVVKHSESEDDITDRSTDLSLVDGAQNTVIQHGDADEEADRSGLERSLAQQPPVLTHQHPVINASEDAGTQSPNLSSTDLLPEIQPESKESLQSDNENGEKHTGEVLQDFSTAFNDSSVSVSDTTDMMSFTTPDEKLYSTPPSLDIITSSPEVRRSSSDSPFESTDVGGQDASQRSPIPFNPFDDFFNTSHIAIGPSRDFDDTLFPNPWSNQSASSFFPSLSVSTDSQDYQTCESHQTSKCSSGSEPNATLHSANSTLCGELNDTHTTAEAALGRSGGSVCGAEDKMPTLEPSFMIADDFSYFAPASTNSYASCDLRKLNEGGLENQHVLSPSPDPQGATLHRSNSEGTLTPAFDEFLLLTSFGSDPGAIQESSSAQPGPHLPSLTSFAPCLTPQSNSSPFALCSLPLLANAAARSPPSAAPKPMLQETPPWQQQQQQQAANQQNSPHPVKPLTTATPAEEKRTEGRSVLATGLEKLKSTIHPGRSSQLSEQETDRKKSVTEGAGSYYHLNHRELVALLVKREADLERQKAEFERQKLMLAKRELELRRLKPQVKDLEDYIDTLLVRIMEQKPTLLQVRSKLK